MSSSKKSPPPIVYIAGVIAIAAAGYAVVSNINKPGNLPTPASNGNDLSQPNSPQQNPSGKLTFDPPTTIPAGSVLKIGGSTSMVQINQALKIGFKRKFPGVQAVPGASSSSKGLTDLAAGTIDLTGISRDLTAAETGQGLVSVPITQDKIAIVVGTANDLRTGLTADQVTKIFTGEFTNWSQVGGKDLAIRPILRPIISGTHQSFQEVGLQGKKFGTGGKFKILDRDATTPLLQALGADGIGYATFSQIANQSTVRSVAIDGNMPTASSYPYSRTLSYVYKGQPNEATKAFLGFATSADGQKLIGELAQSK